MSLHGVNSLLSQSKAQSKKLFGVLIDPDHAKTRQLDRIIEMSRHSSIDFFLIGGSLLLNDVLEPCLDQLKRSTDVPLVLFPGNNLQVSGRADAILLLSMISGRNPDFLIGQHVIAAPQIAKSGIEVIPTGYMLIDGGQITSAQYISNTVPIPYNKPEIAVCTAMAGVQLGLKTIYLDAGSGAKRPVSNEMISLIRNAVDVPLICGGGIGTPQQVYDKGRAGADVIIVGNAIEKEPSLILEMNHALQETGA